jgi:hypothetical protein
MGRPWQRSAYTVRLSKEFEAQVEKAFGSFERWDDIADALYRQLPLRPQEFPVVPGTGYRAVTLETVPRRTVYFVINEDEDTLEFEGLV